MRLLQFKQVDCEVGCGDHGRLTAFSAVNIDGRGADHFAGVSVLFDRGEATLQMQRTWASIVVETIRGVGLLLRLHNYCAWSERVYRAAGYVNHLALIDVNPVEQVFGAILVDGLFELSRSNARLQAERDLRSWLSMGHVPAFGFTPRLAEALRGGVVGVHLDREFFFGKQKLQKQRKTLRVARGRAYEFGTEFPAQVCERSFR